MCITRALIGRNPCLDHFAGILKTRLTLLLLFFQNNYFMGLRQFTVTKTMVNVHFTRMWSFEQRTEEIK